MLNLFFLVILALTPTAILFPYTTLFRSLLEHVQNRHPRPGRHGAPGHGGLGAVQARGDIQDRKSTRLNSSHLVISYAVFCLKKKKDKNCHIQDSRKQ